MMFWEDFEVGGRFEMGRHTFSEEEILEFGRRYDPQPFHIDPHAATAMRVVVDSYLGGAASLGAPVIAREMLAMRASTTRPGVGPVRHRWEAVNQRGELALSMEGWGMFGRRPA